MGNLVGMAYVVTRPNGRFEIRESIHTPKGPRARSLANFATFSDKVLERARRRATRPFDKEAVRAAVQRASGPAASAIAPTAPTTDATVPRHEQPETQRFLEATRRMARSLERLPEKAERRDPGDALMELFEFVANVSSSPAPGPPEPLRFPPLARLSAAGRRRQRC